MKFNNVKMIEHIKKINVICPVCQGDSWELDQHLVDVIYHNTNLSQCAAKAMLTCNTCGNTLFLDPHVADAVEEE